MTGRKGAPVWLSRIGWFVGLWLAGVATVTLVGYGIRAMIL
ncbi:MAG: hypothetical protein WBF53_01820 [Litorimonas sp.]